MRERLQEPPAQEVIRHLFEPAILSDLERNFYNILDINKAHLLMLVDQNIVTPENGKKIMDAIFKLEKDGSGSMEIDPNLEDLYFNIESCIIRQTGMEIGGQMHTARSRNDLYATLNRICSRTNLIAICSMINGLRSDMLKFAKDHLDVIMPGYTHLQPAEPVTLAHYFSAVLHALDRDYERIFSAFGRLNISPLGSGAMASTSFPIDRRQTAELLGFDDIIRNSIDGVASRDYVLEILSSLGIFMADLSRFSHDLYVWSTDEFSYIEVGNSVAACSSIMPQKKNPITLEHVKAKAAHVQASYVSAFSTLKNTPYTHSRDVNSESVKYYWNALYEVEAAISLLTATLKTLNVNKERMLARTKMNFSTVTELANSLVRDEKLSFRAAHHLVAGLVNHVLEQKRMAEHIDGKLLSRISQEVLGKEIVLSEESICNALDPVRNVESKKTAGGPSPAEVSVQLERLAERLEADKRNLTLKEEQLKRAKEALNEKASSLGLM
ncbi:argininosuccinate lyase [Paenibacillus hamazuiensis]|uniref:argininosuccinate lyase n=1 Tax=Paenibacillus hamazuiensis TaxID=2936508 RepID=UPI00200E51E3